MMIYGLRNRNGFFTKFIGQQFESNFLQSVHSIVVIYYTLMYKLYNLNFIVIKLDQVAA